MESTKVVCSGVSHGGAAKRPALGLAGWQIGLSEDDLSDAQLDLWASTAADTSTLIEVNEKWGCPHPETLAALLQAGADIVASTDSHDAAEVGRYVRVRALIGETS